MALSQIKSKTRAEIVQEEQDEHFKVKIEEYRLFLVRYPGHNDYGILLGDEKESNSMMKLLIQKENDRIAIISALELMQMWGADFLSV